MHPIGIDLGTTYSAISKWRNDNGFIGSETYNIASETSDTLASKVFVEIEGKEVSFMVGKSALQKGVISPDNAIWAVKRYMDDANHRFNIEGYDFSPMDISAEILKKLLQTAESIENPGGYTPKGLVVTVPYYFKQPQFVNTKKAALSALKDLYKDRLENPETMFLGLVPEPIAAGLDFAFNNHGNDMVDQNFLIFDLGGGTFDLTIFKLNQTNNTIDFNVLSVDGDARLGGEDFDKCLMDWVLDEVDFNINTLDEKSKARALKKTIPEITSLKEMLSVANESSLIIPSQSADMPTIDLQVKVKDFEKSLSKNEASVDYGKKIELLVDSVLHKANLKSDAISAVLLTGGSSKIPLFKNILIEKFGEKKIRQQATMNLAVARGAAIYAAYLLDEELEKEGKEREHLTVWNKVTISEPTAHSIGIRTASSPFFSIIKDNQITPVSRTLPIIPSKLSEDGKLILWSEVTVLQGDKDSVVGRIKINEQLYTHGKSRTEIKGKLKFMVQKNLIRVSVSMPGCRQDGTDYFFEEDLRL
ncbi:Hsp70 family protein [Aureisphaera galaxeae]|uniref:Hsp70 family protein n=1 Tax=Aureisphaera galaxeae TaxID=1538023 RepID=UPI002350A275|nr:Hsp70 family protein [Aureisphaera galaxeae]MDC8003098.1 Hsp70 family protein [Aureisphaera galaxeae]